MFVVPLLCISESKPSKGVAFATESSIFPQLIGEIKRRYSSGRAFSIGRCTRKGLARLRTDSAKVGESAESSQFDTKTRETMVWRRLFFAEGTLGCEKIGQNSAAWLTQHPRSNQGLMIESSVREYFKHAGDRTAFGIRGSKNHSWYS